MMSELFDEQAQREQYEIEIREQSRAEGRAEGKNEGFLEALIGLVKKGLLTIVQAANEAKMSVSEFEALIQ